MFFKTITILFLGIILLTGCQYGQSFAERENISVEPQIRTNKDTAEAPTPEVKPLPEVIAEPEPAEIEPAQPERDDSVTSSPPQAVNHNVPFLFQAPYAVWDDLHEEACEEAAMIMVDAYFNNKALTAHTGEQAILNLVKWEEINNYKVDLTAAESSEILKGYFNLQAELVEEINVERIKQELNQGKLIIVPAAGRELDNPYFQTPGPIYHMLVIRGYNNQGQFITNDPGTKRGEGFTYDYQQLLSAIHDWNHNLALGGMTDQEMAQGRPVMIVISD